ncbi:MAG TPA: ribosome maturation factor RimM [Sphingomonas sp.]|nr:ribosome maturation factor RimM [Sphingomonas sp.]
MPSRKPTSPSPPPSAGGRGDYPVVLAAVIGAHGVTGEVRLKLFTDDLAPYRAFNDGALTLKSLRVGPNGAIARFAEIADRNAAEALRGTQLTVPRTALPPLGEGEYYHVDLIGLAVRTEDGTPAGTVVAVENFGAGDLIEVEHDGRRTLVPVTAAEIAETVTVPAAFLE